MSSFLLLTGALSLAVALVLCLPLVRRKAVFDESSEPDRGTGDADAQTQRRAEIAVHDTRLAVIEASATTGELDAAAAGAARDEANRQLLESLDALTARTSADSGARSARPAAARAAAWILPLIAALGVIGAGAVVYARFGNLDGLDPALTAARDAPAQAAGAAAGAQQSELLTQTDALAVRLATQQDDGQGWLLLARSRMTLGDPAAAIAAFERASALLPEDPATLADHAEALAMQARRIDGSGALPLVQRALVLDPILPKALWLDGIAALQGGDTSHARERFTALLPLMAAGSPQHDAVTRLLSELDGEDVTRTDSGPADSAASRPADAAVPSVRVAVTLAPALADSVPSDATLFVFAQDAAVPNGTRAPPLAAVRIASPTFPLEVVLDGASAMIPSRTLASAERIVVTARLSSSGTPTPTPGDVEGSSEPLVPSETPALRLVMDRRRE